MVKKDRKEKTGGRVAGRASERARGGAEGSRRKEPGREGGRGEVGKGRPVSARRLHGPQRLSLPSVHPLKFSLANSSPFTAPIAAH